MMYDDGSLRVKRMEIVGGMRYHIKQLEIIRGCDPVSISKMQVHVDGLIRLNREYEATWETEKC